MPSFAPALLRWFDLYGRHDLPWQREPTPYRVWVSEVMLQQTQVATVIPYYERFMARFPYVEVLASASLDEVLHLWTGLGYYARARNLHRAARVIVEEHGGLLPEDIAALAALPGIGRSTAGAILALSGGQRHPILDGNARRVITRYFGVEGHFSRPEVLRCLWDLSEASTPRTRVAAYTQAIMDLGATVCTRAKPSCDVCPLRRGCNALATDRQSQLPAPRPRRVRPNRTAFGVILRFGGAVLLQHQPERGLWGGLYTFPQFETEADAVVWARGVAGDSAVVRRLAPLAHAFTHFDLTLKPLLTNVMSSNPLPCNMVWYDPHCPPKVGVTKPVTSLLATLGSGAQPTLDAQL